VGFGEDRALAQEIARFSAGEAGIAFVFMAVTVVLVIMTMSGMWSGRRRRWLGIVAGFIVVADLGRASLPWIVYYDYQERYASNPIIDTLRNEPWNHRVAARVIPKGGVPLINDQGRIFASLHNEWLEHLFQYYRVQTVDIIQMPRTPVLDETYMEALRPGNADDFRRAGRLWELTNTKYVLGMTGFLDFLNQQFDPGKGRFRIHTQFAISLKPGVEQFERLSQLTAVPATNGPFALFEFEGTLPRALLFSKWEAMTNDTACLERLRDPAFDPHREVLLSSPVASTAGAPAGESRTNGTVKIDHYEAKRVHLRASVTEPSILLLNDRYHPDWNVYVNGERRELLRCNFIMRGVQLEPGEMSVEFRFEPPYEALYVSLGALAVCLVLVTTGFLRGSDAVARGDTRATDSGPPAPRR
jgi:hypothetical protein